MSNLEHLIENGLSALKRGVSYEKWLKTMKDDVNWQGNENISIEQLWTICQYVIYTWISSAQLDRDIPIKPIETTDKAWGIPSRQAVCPKCDYYLGRIAFLDVYKGKRVTYCETCGQAIDWKGWEFDEEEGDT